MTRAFGRWTLIVLRTLFGLFWLFAGINKLRGRWLTTDKLEQIYLQRLTELEPGTLQAGYLELFALPLYRPIAWILTIAEFSVALGLLLGFKTRWAAGIALFILFNLSIGGYYDASLLPFFVLAIIFVWKPTGEWFGLDQISRR